MNESSNGRVMNVGINALQTVPNKGKELKGRLAATCGDDVSRSAGHEDSFVLIQALFGVLRISLIIIYLCYYSPYNAVKERSVENYLRILELASAFDDV